MAKKNVTVRAERIIMVLPKIMRSLAQWHHVPNVQGLAEGRRVDRPGSGAKIHRGAGVHLTFNQYEALMAIRELGGCSVNDLARKLGIAQSTTSQLVDRLVNGGYVRREIFAGDRRRMVVTLSKSGAQMMERRKQSLLSAYSRILLILEEDDQVMLEDAFEKIYRIGAKLGRSPANRRSG
jgi:DNA-binding MarR family transcriptional regulator